MLVVTLLRAVVKAYGAVKLCLLMAVPASCQAVSGQPQLGLGIAEEPSMI